MELVALIGKLKLLSWNLFVVSMNALLLTSTTSWFGQRKTELDATLAFMSIETTSSGFEHEMQKRIALKYTRNCPTKVGSQRCFRPSPRALS